MRSLLYKAMLHADFSVRYWDALIRRHVKKEQRLRLALAFMSSGAAAALLFQLQLDWVWKILGVGAAAISIYLAWLGYGRPLQRMSSLKKACVEAQAEYELLWVLSESGSGPNDLPARYLAIQKKMLEGTHEDSEFPKDDALRYSCQAEVLLARGLQK
jgi:hypothetical protein